MGRKPTRWDNLPRGMRARPRGLKVHYYLDTGEKPRREIPLGSDYVLAVQKWAELTSKDAPAAAEGTFKHVVDAYWKAIIPTKAVRTQADNEKEKYWLLKFFDDGAVPLHKIEPTHVRRYLTWRAAEARAAEEARNVERKKLKRPEVKIPVQFGQVRANREKALLSHIWNFARGEGYTTLPNPCAGIHGYAEPGRDTYVGDDLFERMLAVDDVPLQFALRLAKITGQRPSDVVRMSETHIAEGILHVRQGKTGTKLRLVVEGELKALIDEIMAYKKDLKVRALPLLVTETGKPLTMNILRNRFDDARAAAGIEKKLFQFRDLRARAATDTDELGGTKAAQAVLGHSTEAMTSKYIRHKVGKKVRLIR